MSEQPTRAKSALAGKWVKLGKYAYVCGAWTVCNFVSSGKEVWMLYHDKETIGRFEDMESALQAARERKSA